MACYRLASIVAGCKYLLYCCCSSPGVFTNATPFRLEAAGDGPDAYHKPGSTEADAEFEWLSPNERVRVPYSRKWQDLLLLASEYDLCLTGGCCMVVVAVVVHTSPTRWRWLL